MSLKIACCLCHKCNVGHRRYYLIDNQANLIVICPLNVINKHRCSTEYCQQKHEIIFTNRCFVCQGQLYQQNRNMVSTNEDQSVFIIHIHIFLFIYNKK